LQTLFFLIRDWSVPYEAGYGLLGGQRILDKRLEVAPKQHKELQQLRQHIRASFADLKCFLMPHPGLEVAISPDFRGQMDKISADFKSQLRDLIPNLFDRNNLVVKAINGQQVTCRELTVYVKVANIPDFQQIATSTFLGLLRGVPGDRTARAEDDPERDGGGEQSGGSGQCQGDLHAGNGGGWILALIFPKIPNPVQICGGDTPFMSSAELRTEHERCRAGAVQSFNGAKKMGGQELAEHFRGKLEEDIQVWHSSTNGNGTLDSQTCLRAASSPSPSITTPRTCSSHSGRRPSSSR
jgi:atlastin